MCFQRKTHNSSPWSDGQPKAFDEFGQQVFWQILLVKQVLKFFPSHSGPIQIKFRRIQHSRCEDCAFDHLRYRPRSLISCQKEQLSPANVQYFVLQRHDQRSTGANWRFFSQHKNAKFLALSVCLSLCRNFCNAWRPSPDHLEVF